MVVLELHPICRDRGLDAFAVSPRARLLRWLLRCICITVSEDWLVAMTQGVGVAAPPIIQGYYFSRRLGCGRTIE